MKIAVSSQGTDLESAVDLRFGRAPYFIIYDTDNQNLTAISNAENASSSQGAGVQAAQLVVGQKPDLVISGNFGPKAFAALNAAGIKTASWSEGTVKQAVDLAQSNQLKILDQPNVDGHWV